MTITTKEKELAAVGISVAAGYRPCLDCNFKAVGRAGASDDEIRSAMLDGAAVRAAASQIMADFALAHLGLEDSEPEHLWLRAAPQGNDSGGDGFCSQLCRKVSSRSRTSKYRKRRHRGDSQTFTND